MRYTARNGSRRTSVCVSSQIGCAMGCTFCATGTMGIIGNLTPGEIVEQVLWCLAIEPVRNVVFMGMGEPLQNYQAVCCAIDTLIRKDIFSLRHSRITVSTMGLVDRMVQFIDTYPTIPLALSLHAPNQSLRQQLIPSAHQYPFESLLQVVDYYGQTTGKRMLIEYIVIEGVNSDDATIHELGRLLTDRGVLLNLIPCNPIVGADVGAAAHVPSYVPPTPDRLGEICRILCNHYRIFVTVRREFGNDIWGACGQLVSGARTGVVDSTVRDVEDVVPSYAPLHRHIFPPPKFTL
uniref:Ribosomal RNA large subunit methyltransferase N n=1 Tax=Lygus hesperus TaxID=30085 RepID=A0A146KJE4_LYGHE